MDNRTKCAIRLGVSLNVSFTDDTKTLDGPNDGTVWRSRSDRARSERARARAAGGVIPTPLTNQTTLAILSDTGDRRDKVTHPAVPLVSDPMEEGTPSSMEIQIRVLAERFLEKHRPPQRQCSTGQGDQPMCSRHQDRFTTPSGRRFVGHNDTPDKGTKGDGRGKRSQAPMRVDGYLGGPIQRVSGPIVLYSTALNKPRTVVPNADLCRNRVWIGGEGCPDRGRGLSPSQISLRLPDLASTKMRIDGQTKVERNGVPRGEKPECEPRTGV